MAQHPLPVIAGVVRCTAVGIVNGGPRWANIVHCQYAGGASNPGSTEITALHAVLSRIWAGSSYPSGAAWVQGACRSDTTITEVRYTPLDGSSVTTIKPVNVAGGTSTAALPSSSAVVVSVQTGHRGKRYRGRIYLPAPLTVATDLDGHLTTAIAAQVVAQMRGVRDALTPLQWALGVASYGHSLVKDPNDPNDKLEVSWTPFFTPMTDVAVDTIMDTQRRRKT